MAPFLVGRAFFWVSVVGWQEVSLAYEVVTCVQVTLTKIDLILSTLAISLLTKYLRAVVLFVGL